MERTPYRRRIAAYAVSALVAVLLIRGLSGRRSGSAREEKSDVSAGRSSMVSVENGVSVLAMDSDTRMRSGIVVGTPVSGAHGNDRSIYGIVMDPRSLRELRDRHQKCFAELENARLILDSSQQALQRVKSAGEGDGAADRKHLLAAEDKLRLQDGSLRAAEEHLRAIGHEARARWGKGVVSWMCDHRQRLDSLVEGRDVIIEIAAPAGQLSPMPLTPAGINVAGDTTVPLELISPVPLINPMSGSASFFYLAPASASGLVPGMTVSVHLPAGQEKPGVFIPESAVVWSEGRAWAYLEKDKNKFSRRAVSGEPAPNGGWFASSGFEPGERVVIEGAQLLLSEEFLSQYSLIEIAE
ncbi:MAG: hypothetical protein NT045_03140 [Candidatus Aureabacteria bacterium]|nr:hypothetical protein [Candidatus Auribacterota bacterium]